MSAAAAGDNDFNLSVPARAIALVGAYVGIVFLALVDWLTGREIGLSLFYILPVGWVASRFGRKGGFSAAVFAAVGWWFAEAFGGGQVSWLAVAWNTGIRFGIFAVVAWLVAEVKRRRDAERQLEATAGQLEETVRKRTLDYEQANSQLANEVKERTQAQEALKRLNENLEREVLLRNEELDAKVKRLINSERQLQQKQGILQSILDHITDGVLLVDSSGSLQSLNPAAEQLFHGSLTVTEVPGWLVDSTLLPAELSRPGSGSCLLDLLQKGQPLDEVEFRVSIAGESKETWLRLSGRPLMGQRSEVLGAVLVVRDSTSERALERAIVSISEREKRRFGQELHDGLCQQLVSVSLALSALWTRLAQTSIEEGEEIRSIECMVQDAITESRRLARGLYPVALEIFGLGFAIRELVERSRGVRNWECSFKESGGNIEKLDSVVALNIYRITQEAVSNALKHSRGSRLVVCMLTGKLFVEVTVEDDGIGLDQSRMHVGMGLSAIRDRARLIGAELSWQSSPSGGLLMKCRWNWVSDASNAADDNEFAVNKT